LQRIPDISVSRKKDDATTQDFGATLVLVLGTPAVIAVASGIASFLKRHHAKLSIFADGRLVVEGVEGKDMARIVEALTKPKK